MQKPPPTDVHFLDDREASSLVVEVFPESVVIVGPQGVSLALTPDAAVASAEVLLEAATEAHKL